MNLEDFEESRRNFRFSFGYRTYERWGRGLV